jgi:hypothetical protein
MEYQLVHAYREEEINRRVTELLNDGWELYGNIVVAGYYAESQAESSIYNEHCAIFAQALTRDK